MANLRLYPSGLTVYKPSSGNQLGVGGRTACAGWTQHSSRSLIRTLMRVDAPRLLQRDPWAFTLTLRRCPPTPADWKRLREVVFRELHQRGDYCMLWLTEWQARGVPHYHGIVCLPDGSTAFDLVNLWLHAAHEYGAFARGQHIARLTSGGWLEYLAKHAARGVNHYQRSSANIPKPWKGKTGRMWGRRGSLPLRDGIDLEFDSRLFYRIRRDLRNYARAKARRYPCRSRSSAIVFARTMLRHSDPVVSRVRGLSSFVNHVHVLKLLDHYKNNGASISC